MGNLVAYVRAELQEGDRQLKSDDTYWQNADYALLLPGTYHFAGTLFNKANGSPYAFYRMRISGIRLAPEPVPPRREICCSCGCSCSNEDGNNTSVSSLTLSGDDVGICPSTAAAEPSDTPWPASAETEGESAVIPLGLKRRSLWDWEASLSGMHLSIDTGEGQPLLFLLQSGASVAEPAGSSTNLNYRIRCPGTRCQPHRYPWAHHHDRLQRRWPHHHPYHPCGGDAHHHPPYRRQHRKPRRHRAVRNALPLRPQQ